MGGVGRVKIHVKNYTARDKGVWDEFVNRSKNPHFMFYRDYMDYHCDRFADQSFMCYNEAGCVIALLPANLKQRTLISHEGLSFGGLIADEHMTTTMMADLFEKLLDSLSQIGVEQFVYKSMPHIYYRLPGEEDGFFLFRHHAELIRRDVLSVIAPDHHIKFQSRRLRGVRRAERSGLYATQSGDFHLFWQILEQNLKSRHGVQPAHTLSEIRLLAERFPRQIQLFVSGRRNEISGGVVIYETDKVVHAQYIANTQSGRATGALDLLFHYLINEYAIPRGKYFDFGISNHTDTSLNCGLTEYKESFGARTVLQNHYLLKIK